MTAEPNYDPARTGLLFVDPYNDFLSEGGKLWPRVKEVAEQIGLIDNLRAIVKTQSFTPPGSEVKVGWRGFGLGAAQAAGFCGAPKIGLHGVAIGFEMAHGAAAGRPRPAPIGAKIVVARWHRL
jgi:hypothetical protein